MPNERNDIESLSGPEAHDKLFIAAYNEGKSYKQIQEQHPEYTKNFIELRLKLMAAMGEVELRVRGANNTTAKRGSKGQFEQAKEEK